MAANEFQEFSYAKEGRHSSKEKAQMSDIHSKHGEKLEKFNLIHYYELSKLDNAITQSRFLNRPELKTKGDTNSNSSIAKPWRLWSVQQIEDHKSLIRICPILSSSIFFSNSIGVLMRLKVLQALTIDRHIGPQFTIPARSTIVFILASTAISFTLINQILYTIWQKLSHQSPTPLQRMALDHVFNALRLIVAALFKSIWLKITKTNPLTYGCRRH
ncbi:protein nrt1/ ptr family 2.6 [Quercus suber]|uniref:Protein nrt1/ ptr family 2.6 n=1 Tax=Quercus suber TaxID=58331 RepID=A0AAW0KNW2_QUESU